LAGVSLSTQEDDYLLPIVCCRSQGYFLTPLRRPACRHHANNTGLSFTLSAREPPFCSAALRPRKRFPVSSAFCQPAQLARRQATVPVAGVSKATPTTTTTLLADDESESRNRCNDQSGRFRHSSGLSSSLAANFVAAFARGDPWLPLVAAITARD